MMQIHGDFRTHITLSSTWTVCTCIHLKVDVDIRILKAITTTGQPLRVKSTIMNSYFVSLVTDFAVALSPINLQ